MRIHKIVVGLLLGALAVQAQQSNEGNDLLGKIREGDTQRVETLLRASKNPNTRDQTGATALMYAAAFASPELLIERGADPNLRGSRGLTPLMMAAATDRNPATVKLLLARSRAIGFQPYVDSGFPHGEDQFISAAATSWAVIALAHTL